MKQYFSFKKSCLLAFCWGKKRMNQSKFERQPSQTLSKWENRQYRSREMLWAEIFFSAMQFREPQPLEIKAKCCYSFGHDKPQRNDILLQKGLAHLFSSPMNFLHKATHFKQQYHEWCHCFLFTVLKKINQHV